MVSYSIVEICRWIWQFVTTKPTTSDKPKDPTAIANAPTSPKSAVTSQIPILPPASLCDAVTRAEIIWAFKLVDSHAPLNFCKDLGDVLKTAFPDSEIAQGFKMSDNKAAYVMNHGIAPYYERMNNKIVNSSKFMVAQFDENLNKISQR